MSKIKLVIADEDGHYVDALSDYLIASYSHVFQTRVYTGKAALLDYLNHLDITEGQGIDVLLVTREMLDRRKGLNFAGVLMFLSESVERFSAEAEKTETVYKYQCGEKLAARVLQAYSAVHPEKRFAADGSKRTRVISVYSPAGGTGKTTIALGCAMQAAWEGKKVFYLNLETFPGVGLFWKEHDGQNLSNVYYYLKNDRYDLKRVIEAAKCREPLSGIYYFNPSDSALDYEEDLSTGLRLLLEELRINGWYDLIFVDMSSGLNKNNLAVLEESDRILNVCTQEAMCLKKLERMEVEFALWERSKGVVLRKRKKTVLNKYRHIARVKDAGIKSKKAEEEALTKIPWVQELLVPLGEKFRLDMNSAFGTAINRLMEELKTERQD